MPSQAKEAQELTIPGFAGEASLERANGSYSRRDTPPLDTQVVTPQAETCEVAYIDDWPGLYVVCCDPDRRPPCQATGIV